MRTIYPGQVSVTADTWLSVQHALPEGVSPVDLGAHKLRCKTVMLEPCNGVRFEQHRDIMDSLGSDHPSEPASRTTSMTASEIRVDFLDDLSDGTGDSNKNAEYDVSLYNVSHRILHERVYPPLRSLRCSSPGYYDSPKPSEGVAIVFCKPRLPKNLNSAAAEKARQRWASIARALLPVYAGYECKSPETGQFTLAFTRMENAIGFCTNAQAMMSQFAARDDSGGWPKELLDAEAKEAKGTEAAVKKEREEARATGPQEGELRHRYLPARGAPIRPAGSTGVDGDSLRKQLLPQAAPGDWPRGLLRAPREPRRARDVVRARRPGSRRGRPAPVEGPGKIPRRRALVPQRRIRRRRVEASRTVVRAEQDRDRHHDGHVQRTVVLGRQRRQGGDADADEGDASRRRRRGGGDWFAGEAVDRRRRRRRRRGQRG